MKCPYNNFELEMALLNIEDKISEIETKLKDKPAIITNVKSIAEFHGITRDQVLNSSNFDKLKDMFEAHVISNMIDSLMLDFNFSHKEAWAIIAAANNLLG